ncbi:hypothetical protein [Kibdelosporangium aridum]|uniref:hypothetical protein n=1 Tax=Kibdelosporangium aridum TaxID=2030 RepID=UPI000526E707
MADRVKLVNRMLGWAPSLCDALRTTLAEDEVAGNIENFAGAVTVPLGLCGPITVNGVAASGSFVVPLATLEGTLVASYSRGARMMNLSGGCETYVYEDSFLPAVQFSTSSLADSAGLVEWCRTREGAYWWTSRGPAALTSFR